MVFRSTVHGPRFTTRDWLPSSCCFLSANRKTTLRSFALGCRPNQNMQKQVEFVACRLDWIEKNDLA